MMPADIYWSANIYWSLGAMSTADTAVALVLVLALAAVALAVALLNRRDRAEGATTTCPYCHKGQCWTDDLMDIVDATREDR